MTEQEWLAATDPHAMLALVRGKASERKLRLFAAACCRRIWHLLEDERSRVAVQVLERYADAGASDEELWSAAGQAVYAAEEREDREDRHAARAAANAVYADALNTLAVGDDPDDPDEGTSPEMSNAGDAAFAAAWDTGHAAHPDGVETTDGWYTTTKGEEAEQCKLLRCIVGNPFGPKPAIDPACLKWQDGTVVRIAAGIYEERRWQDLSILADALLDAGLDDEDVLRHCREPGGHARGCWILDLLLGKN